MTGHHPDEARDATQEQRDHADADTGGGGVADEEDLIELEPSADRHPLHAASAAETQAVAPHVAAGGTAKQDELVPGKLGRRSRGSATPDVVLAREETERLASDGTRDEGRIAQPADADRDVEAFLDEVHHARGE